MRCAVVFACAALSFLAMPVQSQRGPGYRLESHSSGALGLRERFTADQLALIEKLNRASLDKLEMLPQIVLPEVWFDDELSYSPVPHSLSAAAGYPKFLVVYLPGQAFGAYESGMLIRWGPVSSAASNQPTPAGLYALNWRSPGRWSTVNPDWFMRWYFNFGNREGLAFHEYDLPGLPASHGCIRLLARDARWLFDWGEGWILAPNGSVVTPGTPVSIVGFYDFGAAPPWRSLDWLAQPVELPALLPAGGEPGSHQ